MSGLDILDAELRQTGGTYSGDWSYSLFDLTSRVRIAEGNGPMGELGFAAWKALAASA